MEERILKEFLYNHELKFSDIERGIKIRSNKLAYHLKNLVKKNVLKKNGEVYCLSETAETLIPYISEKQSPLSVVLVAVAKNSNQVFLHKRNKRPFKNKLSLPGGRILSGESIAQATKRIMKEKHSMNVELDKVNSVSIEHVEKKDKRVHSFVLIFTSASTRDKIEYTNVSKNKIEIISSDYKLIKNNLKKEVGVNEFLTKD
ncbi:MAG: NUDIX domain-containing protein [Nanoarchaeota archaeon]|nr:NUDIX domain-containing protein [Nanoarchaeota archaeon]